MNTKLLLKVFSTILIVFLFIAAAYSQTCSDGSYQFSDIQAIFASNGCTGCHGNQGGLNLSDYNNVVTGGNRGVDGCGAYPTALDFLIGKIDGSLTSGMCGNPMPAGTPSGTPGMSAGDIAAIQAWIDGGAPEFCPPACATLDLTLTFDDNPQQTTWQIVDAGGMTVASGGPYSNPADNNATIVEQACLPDGCYDLIVNDSANDGMCPRRSSTVLTGINIASIGIGGVSNGIPRVAAMCGNYALTDPAGTSIASGGGRFGTSEMNNFCLSGGVGQLNYQDDSAYQRNTTDFTPQIRLLPNVATDKITLYYALQTESDIHINVVDISGKIVQQYIRNAYDTPELALNISNLNEGFYFVQVISGDVAVVEKFVKR